MCVGRNPAVFDHAAHVFLDLGTRTTRSSGPLLLDPVSLRAADLQAGEGPRPPGRALLEQDKVAWTGPGWAALFTHDPCRGCRG